MTVEINLIFVFAISGIQSCLILYFSHTYYIKFSLISDDVMRKESRLLIIRNVEQIPKFWEKLVPRNYDCQSKIVTYKSIGAKISGNKACKSRANITPQWKSSKCLKKSSGWIRVGWINSTAG